MPRHRLNLTTGMRALGFDLTAGIPEDALGWV
jgi:hypothetical protein